MSNLTVLRTTGGIRFGLLGEKGTSPAPTVFGFAGSVEDALTLEQFNKCGLVLSGQDCGPILSRQHCLAVSLDLPAYGEDIRPGDSGDVGGTLVIGDWRRRIERGEPLVGDFTRRASAVLDHLIREGYTDPGRVAAYGHSRGGFMGLHFAAVDPRVRCVAAFAPLVDFLAVTEFAGMENDAAAKSLALIRHADKLAGRSIWICIGNDDDRVDTDRVIAFARKVTSASLAAGRVAGGERPVADVELHVMPLAGHALHDTASEEGAAWIASRLLAAH